MTNIDEHGIRYTLYRADSIDSDVLHELLYVHGRDVMYQDALTDYLAQQLKEYEAAQDELVIARAESGEDRENPNIGEDDPEFDIEAATERFNDDYQCDEPVHGGTYQDVSYRTTWLGGALHLWVFKSPMIGHFRLCSPCAPNACDSNARTSVDAGYMGYDIPPDWRFVDPCDGKTFAQRLEDA